MSEFDTPHQQWAVIRTLIAAAMAGATDGENQRFYITLFTLLGLILIHTLYYMWWIPRWNRVYNYGAPAEQANERIARNKNESAQLKEMVRQGVTDEENVNEVMAILHDQGFRDCNVLVDFMQSRAFCPRAMHPIRAAPHSQQLSLSMASLTIVHKPYSLALLLRPPPHVLSFVG
jgi:hypothetical protein